MVMIVHPEPATLAHDAASAGNIPPIAIQIHEGLTAYEWGLTPEPNLTKSWDAAPGKGTIMFRRRAAVTFHTRG